MAEEICEDHPQFAEAVQVIARAGDRICLIRDYSEAAGRDNWTLPYDLVDSAADESDEAAAMRVVRGVLGLDPRTETVRHLGSWFDRSSQLRCATIYVAVDVAGMMDIRSRVTAMEGSGLSQIRDMIRTGVLVDSYTLCGLAQYMSRS